MPSLLKAISGWRAVGAGASHAPRPPSSSQDARGRNRTVESQDASIVAVDILKLLREKLTHLFSEGTISGTSSAELTQLTHDFATLKMIEKELFPPPVYEPTWTKLITEHLHQWQTAFDAIEKEVPFLDALQRDTSGVPSLVAKL